MMEKKQTPGTVRSTCNGCGGTGQIGFFRGVSRFVMDWDDCPDCHGTGITEHPAAGETNSNTTSGIASDSNDHAPTTDDAPASHHAEQTGRTGDH